MAIHYQGWCRIEGTPIMDTNELYGTWQKLPANTRVYYGMPEIQLNNPFVVTNGCIYKVIPIEDFGYSTIQDIDANYDSLNTSLNSINTSTSGTNGGVLYYEPFVIDKSSVILYADSTKQYFDHVAVILIDQYATPEIIALTGSYKGQPIPVGDKFDTDDLVLWVIYEDGNRSQLLDNYTITPADKKIQNVGSNVIQIDYTTPTGRELKTNVLILGIKKLVGISAVYDGPPLVWDEEAKRKYFIVTANYSDGSSGTVTDFSFPNGAPDGALVTEANGGIIDIYYKGFYTTATVPTFDVSSSRLIAFYSGPPVEIGHNFNPEYAKVKIYYASNAGYNTYEDIKDPATECTFTPLTIDHEGTNQITVSFTGKRGTISTQMIVIGIKPEIVLNYIKAEYTGPEIIVGKTFSPERVIVKAYYSNGQVVTVNNFTLPSNIVTKVGDNPFTVTFKDKDTTCTDVIFVPGLTADPTMEDGYSPVSIDNRYPEAIYSNNRYRGPAEAKKHSDFEMFLRENLTALYEYYAETEAAFNKHCTVVDGYNAAKYATLNTVRMIEKSVSEWTGDKKFTKGHYEKEEG